MKKVKILLLCLTMVLCLGGGALAGSVAEIELNDGSVLRGEIVSAENGVFKVRSDTLGTVTVEESKIRNIRVGAAGQPAGAERNSGGAPPDGMMDSIRQRLQSDPEIMGMITSMLDDPDIQAVLQDPAVMSAVQSGDITALLANPKFMNILNSRAVQDIGKKLGP